MSEMEGHSVTGIEKVNQKIDEFESFFRDNANNLSSEEVQRLIKIFSPIIEKYRPIQILGGNQNIGTNIVFSRENFGDIVQGFSQAIKTVFGEEKGAEIIKEVVKSFLRNM
jgi:hypothetical protein